MLDFIFDAGGAGLAAALLVGLFRKARPRSSSALRVAVALAAGVLCSFLVTAAQGEPLTVKTAAAATLGGVFIAARAARVGRESYASRRRSRARARAGNRARAARR